jgi:hypothetical protein
LNEAISITAPNAAAKHIDGRSAVNLRQTPAKETNPDPAGHAKTQFLP